MSDSFDEGTTPSTGTDQFTETSTQGWGSRMGGSIVAALIGLLLVPAAIGCCTGMKAAPLTRSAR